MLSRYTFRSVMLVYMAMVLQPIHHPLSAKDTLETVTQIRLKSPLEIRIDGARVHWVDINRMLWEYPEGASIFKLHYSPDAQLRLQGDRIMGGQELVLVQSEDQAWTDTRDVFRHIRHWPQLILMAGRDQVREILRSQVLAAAYDDDGRLLQITHLQTPGVIDALFTYDGELGPIYSDNEISVKVWAPTAQHIRLRLFDENKRPVGIQDPVVDPRTNGVFEFKIDPHFDRFYYRFIVRVYHHADNRIHEYEVTDPYSVSLSTNSEYSQFVNLTDDDLKPAGWDDMIKTLPNATDISLYEAHLRDFSIWDFSVPEAHRGTYMAFTHNGKHGKNLSGGMAHLQRLSDAGLTHLHLLPVNDITTIQEDVNRRIDLHDPFDRICEVIDHPRFDEDCATYGQQPIRDVFEQLAAQNPATEAIQQPYLRIGHHESQNRSDGLASYDGFNWGYDPYHFNAPEGSYSTNPEGVTRILELREMVKSLHEIGLLTVVDVVYNHTSAAGLAQRSILDRLVPGYYMRREPVSGNVETSTCCQNTAAEFRMMEKLMIDSIVLWARAYKIDSFRFDLMGHHPVYVMENILKALAQLTPERDGVDGKNIYLYGEGWNFGEVADDRIFVNATQFNTAGTGIGNFNDRNRDAIRGGMFADWGRNQGFTSGQFLFPNEDVELSADDQRARLLDYTDRIRVGLAGNLKTYPFVNRFGNRVIGGNEGIGYTLLPQENVNYIDKHDNETLWDNTQPKLPMDMTIWDRVYVHTLSQAIINYSQGIPFHQMGTDILRSKSMDRNSYDSGDWFNRVDFSMGTHNWGKGLPPAWDNRRLWDEQRRHLTNPEINVEIEHMSWAHEVFMDQLRIRYSSRLFRLATAEDVHKRVVFHNSGSEQEPGIIVMSISDGSCAGNDLDPDLDGILVIFNAKNTEFEYRADLSEYKIHPVLSNGADQRMHTLTVGGQGIFVPPHSSVVLIKPQQGGTQGAFSCNL